MVARCGEGGRQGKNRELVLNGYKVSASKDEKVLEMDVGDGCTTK